MGKVTLSPMVAGAFAFLLLAMAGIPLTSGFVGKLAVFSVALAAGAWPVVIAAVLASIVAAFLYVRVIKVMYFDPAEPAFDTRPASVSFVAGVGALVTTLFFVFPAPLVAAAQQAARVLFG